MAGRPSKQRYLLIAGDDDEMFMTRSLNVTPKTTEQHLLARSDKSVAYVTTNKRLCSTFCTIEGNYWQTRSIARPLCDIWATCFCGRNGGRLTRGLDASWLRGTVGRTSVFDRRTFPVLRLTYSWWVTTYMGKPSAVCQPTRPTQPFILSG